MTGVRVSRGGAQGVSGGRPGLSGRGKIIGGGFPVGAYGGRKEVMLMLAPEGPVYQAGTLSGNPVAMTAGLATLGLLDNSAYAALERVSRSLEEGISRAARAAAVPVRLNRAGSMVGRSFGDGAVGNFDDVKRSAPGL